MITSWAFKKMMVQKTRETLRFWKGGGGSPICALLDRFGLERHLGAVSRIFFALLLALSLFGAPATAFAIPVSDCAMAKSTPGMVMDHEEMACCTVDCAIAAPAAVLADPALPTPQPLTSGSVAPELRLHVLPSVNPAAVDPPPRGQVI